jgi:hypothetical protein
MIDTIYITPHEVTLQNISRCRAPITRVHNLRYFPLAHDLRYVTFNHLTGKFQSVHEPWGLSEYGQKHRHLAGPH